MISIACYNSSSSYPVLMPSAFFFLPTRRHRLPCLNTSMSSSDLVVVQLLPFLKWTHDAKDIWPRAVDPFFSAAESTEVLRELIFPSDLISCPPWPLPPPKVAPCCLWDQSHVSWRLLENPYYLHLLQFCPCLFSFPNLFPSVFLQ